MRLVLLALGAALLSVVSAPRDAVAQEDPDAEVRRRLARLQKDLDEGEGKMFRWYVGWTAGFGALTAGHGVAAVLTQDHDLRQELALISITSGLGLLSTVALPPAAAFAPARIRAMPERTPEERAAKLAAAERALERAADEQRLASSWLAHAGTAVVSTASFLIRLYAFEHRALAVLNLFPSAAVGEAKIWSMPTSAIDAHRSYRLSVSALPAPGGAFLGVVGSF